MSILNLAGYSFVNLFDLSEERSLVMTEAQKRELKGTILLAPEGLNAFFAGEEDSVRSFAWWMQRHFGPIQFRETWSEHIPFKRMLVKIKKEIITMNWSLSEAEALADYVEPLELKEWLDRGEDVILLDTRKAFEFDLGSFDGAQRLEMKHFREFPDLVKEFPEEWKSKKIVTFCTGGIRCEKAAPYLKQAGFPFVYQLKGGILNYFEICRGSHWRGDLFVFDHRVQLKPDLHVAAKLQCRLCSAQYDRPQDKMLELGLYQACPDCLEKEAEAASRLTG